MNILSLCDNGDVLSVIRLVKIVITIIKIVVPIILILSLMIDYTKAVVNKDNDALTKVNRTAAMKIIAAVLIFYIPTFVNIIADVASFDKDNFLYCFSNATEENIANAYQQTAQSAVNNATSNPTQSSYNQALQTVQNLDNGEDKDRLMGELDPVKDKVESTEAPSTTPKKTENGWWFPVGGSTTTTENGITFAKGAPVGTYLTAYFAGNDSVHQGLGGGHGAIDIGVPRYTYVIASRSGTVIAPTIYDRIDHPDQAIKPDSEGNYNCTGLVDNNVKIDHGDGTMSVYRHFYPNTITVKAGDHVEQGQVIGKVGSSGCSTGPHLHFEVHVNGVKVDPLNYVSTTNTRP